MSSSPSNIAKNSSLYCSNSMYSALLHCPHSISNTAFLLINISTLLPHLSHVAFTLKFFVTSPNVYTYFLPPYLPISLLLYMLHALFTFKDAFFTRFTPYLCMPPHYTYYTPLSTF